MKLDQRRETRTELALYRFQKGWDVLRNFFQCMMKRFTQPARKHQVKLVVKELC